MFIFRPDYPILSFILKQRHLFPYNSDKSIYLFHKVIISANVPLLFFTDYRYVRLICLQIVYYSTSWNW